MEDTVAVRVVSVAVTVVKVEVVMETLNLTVLNMGNPPSFVKILLKSRGIFISDYKHVHGFSTPFSSMIFPLFVLDWTVFNSLFVTEIN